MSKPTLEQAECLVGWPANSVGATIELLIIDELMDMAESIGYEQLSNLTKELESVWRSNGFKKPEDETKYKDLIQLVEFYNSGYGRLSQLAEGLESIWRSPEAIQKYQKIKAERFAMLNWQPETSS